jgi:DNA-binding LytR/AlgR family response regulator
MNETDKNILIIEDEYPIAMDMEMRLQKMGYNVVAIANTYKDALSSLHEVAPDIVLLDINLNSDKSGIDIAEIINSKFKIPIVFVTAYTDTKTFTDALSVDPMGYITKPFKDADLHHNIQIALKKFAALNQNTTSEEVKIENNNIFIKDKGVLRKIDIENILWVEAMDNYTLLHTNNNKYIVNAFLKDVLTKLGSDFHRIHRSHAVAINKISSVEDNAVYIGKTMLIISQSYRQDFLKRLNVL